MRIEIAAQPKFWLRMSLPLVNLLVKLSRAHYDSVCRSASIPGPGAFINGWLCSLTPISGDKLAEDGTRLEDSGTPIMVSASFHDLDTVLKIIEMPPPLEVTDRQMLEDLRESIVAAMRLSNGLKNILLVKE